MRDDELVRVTLLGRDCAVGNGHTLVIILGIHGGQTAIQNFSAVLIDNQILAGPITGGGSNFYIIAGAGTGILLHKAVEGI